MREQVDQREPVRTIAYVMSRFPKLSETFVLYEIQELERHGLTVAIFPLIREREQVIHADAQPYVDRAAYSTPWQPQVALAHVFWAWHTPAIYVGLWLTVVRCYIRSPKRLIRALVATIQAVWMARQIATLKIGHVHAHFATYATLCAYVIHRLTGISYSFTVHADDVYVNQLMLREKLAAADFVVTISEYNRCFLHGLYGALATQKVRVYHCGVDLTVFSPRPQPPTRSWLTITCVARLEEKKGHSYLIDACALLRARGLAIRCQLVGDGELRPAIEAQIARLGLGEHVILLGSQPRDRVRALLAESDVVAMPSIITNEGRQEGIPVALMEAMAMQIPVVATDTSGVSELIEHGRSGLLVPQRNAESLANALLLLAGQGELRNRLGVEARTVVLRSFDLRANTAALARLFVSRLAAIDPSEQFDGLPPDDPHPPAPSPAQREGAGG